MMSDEEENIDYDYDEDNNLDDENDDPLMIDNLNMEEKKWWKTPEKTMLVELIETKKSTINVFIFFE